MADRGNHFSSHHFPPKNFYFLRKLRLTIVKRNQALTYIYNAKHHLKGYFHLINVVILHSNHSLRFASVDYNQSKQKEGKICCSQHEIKIKLTNYTTVLQNCDYIFILSKEKNRIYEII